MEFVWLDEEQIFIDVKLSGGTPLLARILEGDFKTDRRILFENGQFIIEQPYSNSEKNNIYYDMTDVAELHEISEDSEVDWRGTAIGAGIGSMLGAVGAAILGGLYGHKIKVVFAIKFNDGKRALAETDSKGWNELIKADAIQGIRDRWSLPAKDIPRDKHGEVVKCFLLTSEQEKAIRISLDIHRTGLAERQSLLAEIIDITKGSELAEHIVDHLKWESFIRRNPNLPWASPSEDDDSKVTLREESGAIREMQNFKLSEEQVQAYNANKVALMARLVELESLLESIAVATQEVTLPEDTASRLKRILEEDRTELGGS